MKWPGTILRRSAMALAALVAAALLLCLDRVDPHPYFHAPYYTETAARLRAGTTADSITRGELAAGFGRVLLTPTVNSSHDDPAKGQFRSLPLAGYSRRRGQSATGVHDDLYVKAAALRVVITSFNGDYVGYVISPRYYHLESYEARVMSFFGPNLPDYFDEIIRTMVLGVADKQ